MTKTTYILQQNVTLPEKITFPPVFAGITEPAATTTTANYYSDDFKTKNRFLVAKLTYWFNI